MPITPTIGRVIWYYLNPEQREPWTASVAYVNTDATINVGGFDHEGVPFRAHHVPVVDERAQKGHHAMWMPYQKGQAAKTEQVENELSRTKGEPRT